MQKNRPLSFDALPNPAETLHALAEYAGEVGSDTYMTGTLFDQFEERIKSLLGKPAALYLPSGKLAQMAALKVLTGRAGCNRVAMHPRAHLEEYEARSYSELWGMTSAHLGGYDRLPNASDITNIKEPLGAITLEMPMRRLGCQLLPWNDLMAFSEAAKSRETALHLDGARLWESQPYYEKSLAEICSLFDTVYVALDKGIGGLTGAALAGPQWVIDEVRIWQRRAGGRSLRSFPSLLSGLKALDDRLDRMSGFHQKAKSLAAVMSELNNVTVSPNPPQANAFLVTMSGNPEKAFEARDVVNDEFGIFLFKDNVDCVNEQHVRFEVTIRGAAFELEEGEVVAAVSRFAELVLN